MERGYRILIVDDDPVFAKATKAVLEVEGYAVAWAAQGEEALAMMREQPPSLVLLDVMMDWVLEGVSLSREMMEDASLRDIPIIMCTSIRGSEYRGVFPQDEYLHIDSWLDKPCAPEKLIAEIEGVIESRG